LQSLLGNMSHNQLMQLIGPTGLGGLGEVFFVLFFKQDSWLQYGPDVSCFFFVFFSKVLWLVQVWPVCWAVEVLLPVAQPRGMSGDFSMLIFTADCSRSFSTLVFLSLVF